jgi:hypothetical protein
VTVTYRDTSLSEDHNNFTILLTIPATSWLTSPSCSSDWKPLYVTYLPPRTAPLCTLKAEASYSSERQLPTYKSTRCQSAEDGNLTTL